MWCVLPCCFESGGLSFSSGQPRLGTRRPLARLCLSVCLFVCLCACLPVGLPAFVCACLFVLYVCLSACLSSCLRVLPVCLPACVSAYVSACLPACLYLLCISLLSCYCWDSAQMALVLNRGLVDAHSNLGNLYKVRSASQAQAGNCVEPC